jgi:hypothetical protein
VILLASMLISMDPARDFAGGRLAGTLLFFALLAGSLAAGLYSRRVIADGREGSVELQHGLLMVPLWVRRLPGGAVRRIVLRRAVLLRGRGGAPRADGDEIPGGRSGTPKSLQRIFSPGSSRHELAGLYMDFAGDSFKLDSSTEPLSLRRMGEELARFLGVPYAEVEE